MVFKTSQMLLLTSLAKAREKEEVRWTAWPSTLYIKKARPLGMQRTVGPPDQTTTWRVTIRPPRPPRSGSRAGHVDAAATTLVLPRGRVRRGPF
jgi:hypothetical protein